MLDEWLNKIHRGDSLTLLRKMPSDSVDLVMTSPPYLGLRQYSGDVETVWGGSAECEHSWESVKFETNRNNPYGNTGQEAYPEGTHISRGSQTSDFCSKCGAWRGQLGLEPTFTLYIDHLLEIFREVKRVLKPTGSFWLNMGDSSAGSNQGYGASQKTSLQDMAGLDGSRFSSEKPPTARTTLPAKCLIGLPWRVALRMVDEQGWVMRNDVIWFKPNGMPESTQDNLTAHHEYVFFFAKQTVKPYLWRNVKTKQWIGEKPIQSWFDDQGSYQTYWWRCEGVVNRFGEVLEPCDAKGEGWKTRLAHKKMNDKHTIMGPSPLWRGFHYYFDLDAIRVPHASESIERYGRAKRLGARTSGYLSGKFHNPPEGVSKGGFPKAYLGKFDGVGEEKAETFGSPRARTQRSKNKFNMRVRLATRSKGGLEAYSDVKVSESEVLTHDSGGRKQDNVSSRNAQTYAGFNDRWRNRKEDVFDGEDHNPQPDGRSHFGVGSVISDRYEDLDVRGNSKGKNPGDIIEASPETLPKARFIGKHQNVGELRYRGESFSWETHPSKDPSWFGEGGKNPGDFWQLTPEPTKAHHFAAYPLKLCFTPILAACPPDGVVLDPFAGTGTTAEAVEILNISGKKPDWETVKKIRADIKTGHKPLVYTSSRKWILLEISGGYCEIAGKRLAPYI